MRGEEEASVNGVRITAAKYERWEKRARIDEKQKGTHTKNVVEAFDKPSSLTRSDRISYTPSTDFPRTSRHEQSSDMLIVSPSTPPREHLNRDQRIAVNASYDAENFQALISQQLGATCRQVGIAIKSDSLSSRRRGRQSKLSAQ